jgi:diadenylate cyclase
MNNTITIFLSQINYLFTHITLINVLDILLVAGFFFVIFQALYQTRALQLLRGITIIAILGVALLLVLPLETFTLLVQGLLLAGIIALPILFQDELRRALTGLGQIGTRRTNDSTYDQFRNTILTSVKELSSQRHGALIVLEGQTPLDDVIETGIPTRAHQVTPELLNTIFYPNTPLHDGAVVLRGDRLMAAGCILPVQKEQTKPEHLGTRHRAALGLSFIVPDALIIVVSEETGNVSVAHDGRLYRGLSESQLEDWLDRFNTQLENRAKIHWGWLRSGGPRVIVTNLLIALALAIVAWVSVTIQTNPPVSITIPNVPLSVIPPDPELILTSNLPENVQVLIQTTKELIEQQDSSGINAEITLSDLSPGVHSVPVEVNLANSGVQLINVNPSFVKVTLEANVSKEFSPNISILDPHSLPVGYTYDEITTTPETILVQGQESLVSQVVQARAIIQLNGRSEDFQQVVPVKLLDQDGKIVEGLTPSPQQILVEVKIKQTFYTKEVPIQAIVNKESLDPDYEITSIIIEPSTAILTGNRSALADIGDFIETAPIDLTDIYSEFTLQVPLVLPTNITALNKEGDKLLNTNAHIIIKPKTDYLVLTRWIEEIGLDPALTANISETRVSVLLFGPRNLLDEVEKDPTLVTVYLDLADLTAGSYTLPVEYRAPSNTELELFPAEIDVILVEKP